MTRSTLRNWLPVAYTCIAGLLCIMTFLIYRAALRQTLFAFISGWTLFGLILLLTAYNLRKKLPFLPVFTSAQWLQFHIYAGFLTILLLLLHVDFRIPQGIFEIVLTLIYIAVTISGIVGLVFTRVIPRRLTTRGDEVLFERIPFLMRQIHEQVEGAVDRVIDDTQSVILADYYARRLLPFFVGPRNIWSHLTESRQASYTLISELSVLDRYMNERERVATKELTDLIRVKDDLDYRYAYQMLLKYWLFAHIPLTYSLLMLGSVHALLVHAFAGGMK